jgi:phage baseplate assembly protein W
MRTLVIQDGDIVLGSEGFSTIGGYSKLTQDLGAALREPLGVDRFHPTWGSLLPSFIGHAIVGPQVAVAIRSEVYRVIQNYLMVIAEGIKRDSLRSNQTRYEAGEVIKDITSIDVRQEQDRFHVRINIQTLSNQNVTLVQTVRH